MYLPPRLPALPVEILEACSSSADDPEFLALRLTCKEIEIKLLHSFGKRFFTNKRFWRNAVSLRALDDIAESRLSPFLKNLTIGTELLSPLDSGTAAEWISEADQQIYSAAGPHAELLASSLSKLPNLNTLAVDAWDPTGGTYQTGWGFKTLYTPRIVSDAALAKETRAQRIACVQMVLCAMTLAWNSDGLPCLTGFQICSPGSVLSTPARPSGGCQSFDCSALCIPDHLASTVLPLIQSLKRVDLDVKQKNIRDKGMIFDRMGRISPHAVELITLPLKKFLTGAKHLEYLGLGTVDLDGFWWDWISAPANSIRTAQPSPPSFSHLRELSIGKVAPPYDASRKSDAGGMSWKSLKTEVPYAHLVSLITKLAATLVKFRLYGVALVKYEHLDHTSALQNKQNIWREMWEGLFAVLSEQCSVLNEVDFRQGFMIGRRSFGSRIIFYHVWGAQVGIKTRDAKVRNAFSYRGSDIRKILERQIVDMMLVCPDRMEFDHRHDEYYYPVKDEEEQPPPAEDTSESASGAKELVDDTTLDIFPAQSDIHQVDT